MFYEWNQKICVIFKISRLETLCSNIISVQFCKGIYLYLIDCVKFSCPQYSSPNKGTMKCEILSNLNSIILIYLLYNIIPVLSNGIWVNS